MHVRNNIKYKLFRLQCLVYFGEIPTSSLQLLVNRPFSQGPVMDALDSQNLSLSLPLLWKTHPVTIMVHEGHRRTNVIMLVMPSSPYVSRVLKQRHPDVSKHKHIDVFCMRVENYMRQCTQGAPSGQTCSKLTFFLDDLQYYACWTFQVRAFLDYEQDWTSSRHSFAPVQMPNVHALHSTRKPWIFVLYTAHTTAWSGVLRIKHVYDTCDCPSSAQTLLHTCTRAYLKTDTHVLVSKLCLGHYKAGGCLDQDDFLYDDDDASLGHPVLARAYILNANLKSLRLPHPCSSPRVLVDILKRGLQFRKIMTTMAWKWNADLDSVMSVKRPSYLIRAYGGSGFL